MKHVITSITVVLSIIAIFGCANTATCDPDQRFKNGMCFPKAAQAAVTDAGGDAEPGPVTCTPDAAPTGQFNRTCTKHSECGCPAPVCAVPPGQKQGFCTRTCLDDPAVCPSNFNCIDLSAIDPSYPKTCLPSGLTP